MLRREKGFTLIELVMVIVILGILAAVAIPTYINLSGNAQDSSAKGVLGSLRSANAIILANRAVTNDASTWTMGIVVGSANIQGATVSALNATSITVTIGSSVYTFTLNPAGPSIANPATITAGVGTFAAW